MTSFLFLLVFLAVMLVVSIFILIGILMSDYKIASLKRANSKLKNELAATRNKMNIQNGRIFELNIKNKKLKRQVSLLRQTSNI